MPFECPVCQTSNPDSSAACGKCATPNPFLTSTGDSGVKTVAAPFPGSEALSGGLTTPLVSGVGSPGAASAASRARAVSGSTLFAGAILAGRYEIVTLDAEPYAYGFKIADSAYVAPFGSTHNDEHTVKAGLNYRFNWGGPVVAKY